MWRGCVESSLDERDKGHENDGMESVSNTRHIRKDRQTIAPFVTAEMKTGFYLFFHSKRYDPH